MSIIKKAIGLFNLFLILLPFPVYSQVLYDIGVSNRKGLTADNIVLSDSSIITLEKNRPFFSFRINNKLFNSGEAGDLYSQTFEHNIRATYFPSGSHFSGWEGKVVLENNGSDTVRISNFVPFGENGDLIYITEKGSENLASVCLFRPGFTPVKVFLPDAVWELGYSSFSVGKELSLCAISRCTTIVGGMKQKYLIVMPPKAKVSYLIHADVFKGEWQNGLRMMFKDKYLYDTEKFDDSVYKIKELDWIKESYLVVFQMAWDRKFYDRFSGKFSYEDVFKNDLKILGNIDVYGICPSLPQINLDGRNSWDLYRNIPGGTEQLKSFVHMLHKYNTRFFIADSPGDTILTKELKIRGISQILTDTEADGILINPVDSSDFVLQRVIDTLRKGVVVYSEGIPSPKNMAGIISGRVNSEISQSQILNLNKLIKPDFSVFRICNVGKDILRREAAVSFFNGCGTELNMFYPGSRDEHYIEDLDFLARTTFILKQNNDVFLDQGWTPLVETTIDSVFVNGWRSGDKTIYTILDMRSGGDNENIFKVDSYSGKHFVSLWNHEDVQPSFENGIALISSVTERRQQSFSGSRKEVFVDCIAGFPELIRSQMVGDSLKINISGDGMLLIWKGNPSYHTEYKEINVSGDTVVNVNDIFNFYEGKIVLQLVENKRLKDENILFLKYDKPWIISKVIPTKRSTGIPSDMVLVPGADLLMHVESENDYISYPDITNNTIRVDSFLIDKYPVTNEQYHKFINNSGYRPADTSNYLRHWHDGIYKQGQEKYPVVYISYEDMKAYSEWAGKRLPTQAEWQLAAQGTDSRKWPWGNEFHGTYCNNSFNKPTPVDAFPKGQSKCGAYDLVGNIWQMTNDIYFNGFNYFAIIRGGSYFNPDSGSHDEHMGPRPLDKTQILIMVSPGFDRRSTIGFRCVMDVDSKKLK